MDPRQRLSINLVLVKPSLDLVSRRIRDVLWVEELMKFGAFSFGTKATS
jgi:hypothetical protein